MKKLLTSIKTWPEIWAYALVFVMLVAVYQVWFTDKSVHKTTVTAHLDGYPAER